jgi:hypothetical protein
MVDELLLLFEQSDPSQQLIDFVISVIFLKTLCEFLQLSDLVE